MYQHKMMDIYIDGSSIGNPGDAGIGIVFAHGEEPIKNMSKYIGRQTNNFAEYTALIFALQEALVMKTPVVNIYSDSELLCRQLKGEYKVKSGNIKNLFAQALTLIGGFEKFNISQIPRQQNKGADKLAHQAIKKYIQNRPDSCLDRIGRGGKSEL
jgi:ribonuclease HI